MGERYIHGTSRREQTRLELMNSILNARCLAELELAGGERVLELGAGTGIFAAELARAVGPDGRVLAIERDARQLAEARRRALECGFEVRGGDVYDPPLDAAEWSGFDLVHARFLLEHLQRPDEAVRVMVRAARPGGRIVLIDDDHALMRFWPDPGGMVELWADYARQYARLGLDPFVGRRLVELLLAAGATPLRTTQIQYGGCSHEPGFGPLARNLAEVIEGSREHVLAGSGWTADRFDAALEAYRAWTRRPGATIWYGLPCAVGRRS